MQKNVEVNHSWLYITQRLRDFMYIIFSSAWTSVLLVMFISAKPARTTHSSPGVGVFRVG